MEVKFRIPNPLKAVIGVFDRINIWHIILLDAVIRFFVMQFPSDGGMIFDEVHYIKATRAMMEGLAANAEHPPLTKIIELFSIKFFGDWWFAWRMPIILFSLVSTYIIYLIAKDLLQDEKKALIATIFSCVDIILFIHGNIYMLEIPALVFALGFVYYFLKKKYILSAVLIGFGFLCNEKALFLLLGMFFYQTWSYFKPRNFGFTLMKRTTIFLLVCVIVGAGGLFVCDQFWKPASGSSISVVSSVVVYQNATGPFTTSTGVNTNTAYQYIKDPFSHVWFMFTYFTGINAGIPQITETWRPPWGWIAPIGDNWNNPPTYLSTTVSNGVKSLSIINYRAQTTIPIWFMTIPLIILAFIYHIENVSKVILGWIAGSYMPWFIWEFFKMNMPFNHYMMFTIPILCIGIPWFWSKVWPKHQYEAMTVHLIITILYFLAYFPITLVRIL